MTDPIERRLAQLKLPEPTPDLDRRIGGLLATQRPRGNPAIRARGVLAIAGGALAAGFLAIMFHAGPPDRVEIAGRHEHRRGQTPVVETVRVEIPILDLSPEETANEQDRLFPAGTVVVSTSIQESMK